ncbi:unnamed protein product, partial [Heligmosomoides polygyrus]|uniref:CPG4 domain-containing protein n=1 Tax=Heligmosomoides polygyrus TaxID=6339 RepID=A0A183GE47_HELPZ
PGAYSSGIKPITTFIIDILSGPVININVDKPVSPLDGTENSNDDQDTVFVPNDEFAEELPPCQSACVKPALQVLTIYFKTGSFTENMRQACSALDRAYDEVTRCMRRHSHCGPDSMFESLTSGLRYIGNTKTQIDFILVKRRDRRLVTDAKVEPYKTVATQHRPLICTLKFAPPRLRHVERGGRPKIKWWQFKENAAAFVSRIPLPTVTTVDKTWKDASDTILQAARSQMGMTEPGRRNIEKYACL